MDGEKDKMEIENEELFGVLSRGEQWEYQRQYFPSKLGGYPAWLDPINLPTPQQLQCDSCSSVLTFLLQIYSPTDDDFAFHRTIYIFACQPCMNKFKAFRCQLSRKNPHYNYNPQPPNQTFPSTPHDTPYPTCSACKLPTSQNVPLHDRCRIAIEHGTLQVMLPEYLFDICSGEIKNLKNHLQHEKQLLELYKKKSPKEKDVHLSEQEAIECIQAERGINDLSFERFCNKTTPNEVIYYCRNGTPFYVCDTSPRPQGTIPTCQACGSSRSFEFQILPQLLFHLQVQRIEFGTVTIYTCEKSCNITGYAQEFVFVETDVSLHPKNIN